MKFPICDLTYTTEGYKPDPWYARTIAVPDKWLAALRVIVKTDVRPKSPNFIGEFDTGSFLTYCDITDPDLALNLIEEGECPPMTCVPEAVRYSTNEAYRIAVDTYNAAVVRFALNLKGDSTNDVQEG